MRGEATINGKAIALSTYCAKATSTIAYAVVDFKETTHGYTVRHELRCNKSKSIATTGSFSTGLFPGTYQVSVYVSGSYAKVPVSGTQVVVGRLQVK